MSLRGQALLEAVCRGRWLFAARGELDIERASAVVLDEFRDGKLGRLTLEKAPPETAEKAPVKENNGTMRSDSQERRMAMIAHDQPYWVACARVAGMDEAGRGPLAGDVAGGVCRSCPARPRWIGWMTPKKLSALRRDKVYEEILRTALYVGVGRASAQEIDGINILQATMNAMRRAAADAQANIYLIDAVKNLGWMCRKSPSCTATRSPIPSPRPALWLR
ncbi:MAG: hypothetical protein V8Q82_00900 [Christensenellales bacterium]